MDTTSVTVGQLSATMTKSGIQTSEFRGKTIVQLVTLAAALFDTSLGISGDLAITIIGLIEAAYAVSRGITKRGSTMTAESKELIAAIVAALEAQAKANKEETTP